MSRLRSKSVPSRKPQLLSAIERNIPKTAEPRVSSGASYVKSKTPSTKSAQSAKKSSAKSAKSEQSHLPYVSNALSTPQSLSLSRGCLKLNVNFPSDTLVKFRSGTSQQLLFGQTCFCRNAAKACWSKYVWLWTSFAVIYLCVRNVILFPVLHWFAKWRVLYRSKFYFVGAVVPNSVYQDIYNYFAKKELANIVNVWTWSC